MQFRSAIAFLAVATAISAAPCNSCEGGDSGSSGDSGSKCSNNQELKCCTGLTNGILNLGILPALCLPLLSKCNNQAACCESNGLGLLNCLTIQI
ncbi:hypothetical protein BDV26DRAFT_298366 [Aspergillus bertholletiae]|uniref:Hydrophobin n=1 Tax=Aspergillus bertholletiae TaxID=1226010 RepID=A0A5N7APV9_9EURO|nr:hypothetical protein BDV26DRAFT_298366 [Aspergillus bertholletiae]